MGQLAQVGTSGAMSSVSRPLAVTRNGFLWAAYRDGTSGLTRIALSTDGGVNWATKLTFGDVVSMALRAVPGVDGRDWLVISYVYVGVAGVDSVRNKAYRLFDSVDPREIGPSIQLSAGGDRRRFVDLEAVTVGGNCYVTTRWSQDNSTNTFVGRAQTRWQSADSGGPSNVGYLHQRNDTDGGTPSPGSLSARRVGLFAASQPDLFHLWAQDHNSQDERKVYWQRLRWAGSGWTPDPPQVLATDGFASRLAGVYSGKDHMAAWVLESDAANISARITPIDGSGTRFAADPPPLGQGVVLYMSLAADPDSNDFWLLAAGQTDGRMRYCRYRRTTDTWDAWAQATSSDTLNTGEGAAVTLTVGDKVGYLYTTSGGGTALNVRHATAALTNRPPYQPVWTTQPGLHDRTAPLTLAWQAADPDNDTLVNYRVRRAAVTGVGQDAWQYWQEDGSWGSVLGQRAGASPVTLPSNWATEGQRYLFGVAVLDLSAAASAWSQSLAVTGVGPPAAVTITAPSSGAVIEEREFVVSWTPAAAGGAFVELVSADGSTVVWSRRVTSTTSALVAPVVNNNQGYLLRVVPYSAAGLPGPATAIPITIQWTPPPAAVVSVTVVARPDSEGRTVDAGLQAEWATPEASGNQPAAQRVDLYRYPTLAYPGGAPNLEAATLLQSGAALDGTYVDLSAPGGTLLTYVAVTIADDGTSQRSDLAVYNLLTAAQSSIEDSAAVTQFSAGALTSIARTTDGPIQAGASLALSAADATGQVAVSTRAVLGEYGAAQTALVDVVDTGGLVDVQIEVTDYDETGALLQRDASSWQAQPALGGQSFMLPTVMLSANSTRAGSVPANQATISGKNNYVWLDPGDEIVTSVQWRVNGATVNVDAVAPYDLYGGSANSAADWDVTTAPKGGYLIEAYMSDGATPLASATIEVI